MKCEGAMSANILTAVRSHLGLAADADEPSVFHAAYMQYHSMKEQPNEARIWSNRYHGEYLESGVLPTFVTAVLRHPAP